MKVMHRILAALILLFLGLVSSAFFTPPGPPPPAPKASFVGPCDQGVPCTDGYGAERLTSNFTGRLLNAINVSTSTTQDIGYDTNGGLLASDLPNLGCTTDTSCKVVTLYSQFGGCNPTQGNTGKRAFIHVSTTENGHAAISFNGSDPDEYDCTNSSLFPGSANLLMVATPNQNTTTDNTTCTANFGNVAVVIQEASDWCQFALVGATSTNNSQVYAETTDSSGAGHWSTGGGAPTGLFCAASQGSSSIVQSALNGTADTSRNPGSVLGVEAIMQIGSGFATVAGYTGEIDAVVVIVPAVSTFPTNTNTVTHQMGAFWASSNPC